MGRTLVTIVGTSASISSHELPSLWRPSSNRQIRHPPPRLVHTAPFDLSAHSQQTCRRRPADRHSFEGTHHVVLKILRDGYGGRARLLVAAGLVCSRKPTYRVSCKRREQGSGTGVCRGGTFRRLPTSTIVLVQTQLGWCGNELTWKFYEVLVWEFSCDLKPLSGSR